MKGLPEMRVIAEARGRARPGQGRPRHMTPTPSLLPRGGFYDDRRLRLAHVRVPRPSVFDTAHSVCWRAHGPPIPQTSTLRTVKIKRWWCAITTHKWRRERVAGT